MKQNFELLQKEEELAEGRGGRGEIIHKHDMLGDDQHTNVSGSDLLAEQSALQRRTL
jgi:hypothetical protein